jgi:predicted phage terminase large subunit-like protein
VVFGVKALERIRASIGGSAWAALYQQRPAAAEGALFKREWWRFWNTATLPARFERIVLSLDTAFKAGATNDFSVGLVLGVASSGYYVLDLVRERVEFPELKRRVEMLATRHPLDIVLIEDKASGQSLIQELRNGRLPVFPIKVDSDKVSRATAVSPMVEGGKVFLPEGAPWLADFLDEVSSFPAAPHDDQVDALSQVLNYSRDLNGGVFEYYREQTLRDVFERSRNMGIAAAEANLTLAEAQKIMAEQPEDDMWATYTLRDAVRHGQLALTFALPTNAQIPIAVRLSELALFDGPQLGYAQAGDGGELDHRVVAKALIVVGLLDGREQLKHLVRLGNARQAPTDPPHFRQDLDGVDREDLLLNQVGAEALDAGPIPS